MSYKVAAIDIHKKVLMVVVAAVAEEVADATGAAVELECRTFGTGARERNHLVSAPPGQGRGSIGVRNFDPSAAD